MIQKRVSLDDKKVFKCNEVFENIPARKLQNPISGRTVCMTLLLCVLGGRGGGRSEIPRDIQNWSACEM